MNTGNLLYRLSILALIIWVGYSWAKGPSQSTIDRERFKIIEGKLEGPFHLINIRQPLHFNDENWFEYRNNLDEKHHNKFDSLLKHYAVNTYPKTDTLKLLDSISWQALVHEYKKDSIVGDTIFLGDPVRISKKVWFEKSCLLRAKNYSQWLWIDYDVFFDDLNMTDVENENDPYEKNYFKYTEHLTNLMNEHDYLKAKILLADTVSYHLSKTIFEIIDEHGNTIVIDSVSYHDLKDPIISAIKYGSEKIVYEHLVWYKRGEFRSTTFLILIVGAFFFYVDKRSRSRKPAFKIQLLDIEGALSWNIIEKKRTIGPFSIQLDELEIRMYYGVMGETSQTLMGIAFVDGQQNGYHFYAKDYFLDSILLKDLESIAKNKVKVFEVTGFYESTGENSLMHFYDLKSNEKHEYTSSYRR